VVDWGGGGVFAIAAAAGPTVR